jgi:hypothetical protein
VLSYAPQHEDVLWRSGSRIKFARIHCLRVADFETAATSAGKSPWWQDNGSAHNSRSIRCVKLCPCLESMSDSSVVQSIIICQAPVSYLNDSRWRNWDLSLSMRMPDTVSQHGVQIYKLASSREGHAPSAATVHNCVADVASSVTYETYST